MLLKRLMVIFAIFSFLSTACAATPSETTTVKLRIAVIPVIDTLPMFVAQAEGLFKQQNIEVEFVPVASAPERDQILQAGQADGTLNETLAVMLFNKESVQLQAVRYGLMATENSGHFFILASGKSGITAVNDLKGTEIGISQGTIIDYVTTRLLEKNGFSSEDIKTVAVPKISDRMSLLATGEIKAAVMPDPLAALAITQGAKIILDDSQNPKLGASVISFRKEIIDAHPEAIKSFLTAIESAVVLINTNPDKYKNLLAEKKIVPQVLIGEYKVPKFPTKGIPSASEWGDVLDWAKSKKILDKDIHYTSSVNQNFLPK